METVLKIKCPECGNTKVQVNPHGSSTLPISRGKLEIPAYCPKCNTSFSAMFKLTPAGYEGIVNHDDEDY